MLIAISIQKRYSNDHSTDYSPVSMETFTHTYGFDSFISAIRQKPIKTKNC